MQIDHPKRLGCRRASDRTLLAGLLALALVGSEPGFSQGAAARPTVAAVTLEGDEAIRLDGVLDEAVWQRAGVARDFKQREPYEGEPATENTALRFVLGDAHLYIAIVAAAENLIARQQARDALLAGDDSVAIILDTFHDRRNAYVFETNGNGARRDLLVTDEGRDVNSEWDGIWRVAAKRSPRGFTAEIEIPFSTLRFDPAQTTWGLQIVRRVAAKSEQDVWSPTGRDADEMRISLAGTLTGLRDLRPSQQLQVKPFVTADLSNTRVRAGGTGDTTSDAEFGVDAKWGPTRNLSVDLTVNTDFAEVEVDEQRVNLTRFPLFLPEKREFFLENAGLFEFGPVKRQFDFDPVLMKVFFSRRIGLDSNGQAIPIRFGTRLTGRVGNHWSVGALGVVTRADDGARESTEFGVARVVRNLGTRSNIGLIATERRYDDGASNRVVGLDATFNPTRRLGLRGFVSESRDRPGASGDRQRADGTATGFEANYEADTWSIGLEGLEVDDSYDPGMGFLLRRDFRFVKPRAQIRTRIERFGIRNLQMGYTFKHIAQESSGVMESRQLSGDLIGFETFGGSSFFIWAEETTERLFEPFEIRPGVTIDPGRYDFDTRWSFFYWSPSQKKFFWQLHGGAGGFFDGDRRDLSAGATYRPNKFLQLSLNRSWTEIELPGASFTTEVLSLRGALSFNPNQRVDAFVQWSDSAEVLGLNLRYNWIYRPGADLFVVYNKAWQATSLSHTETTGDQVVVKFTYLFSR